MIIQSISYQGWRLNVYTYGAGWRVFIYAPGSTLPETTIPHTRERKGLDGVIDEAMGYVDRKLSSAA